MLSVGKTFEFAASHRLYRADWSDEQNLKIFGKCANKNGHGHNYRLEISVTGSVDSSTGMIFDASKLSAIVDEVLLREVDHKNLDKDVSWLSGTITTTENLVSAFWDRLEPSIIAAGSSLCEIKLWETGRIFAVKRLERGNKEEMRRAI